MKLLYICGYNFRKVGDSCFALSAYGDAFWEKYLASFDEIHVLGEPVPDSIPTSVLQKITNERMTVTIIPSNSKPNELINDFAVIRSLKANIKGAESILIKQASRKGNMAVSLAEKYNKPYMIELTGDMNLDYKTSNSILRKLYRPFLYSSVKRHIKNCEYGLYVTQEYLQKVYPIKGKAFGCSDVVIEQIDDKVLECRLMKINEFNPSRKCVIGLIGSYQKNRKGIDTAIKALSNLDLPQIELHVLGTGSEKYKKILCDYAKTLGVQNQLFFDNPLNSQDLVFDWIDHIDICILPSRSEGLPRCLIEAMSRACPCISSDVCGIPELIQSQWLHKPGDDFMLSSKIKQLMFDKYALKNAANVNFNNSKEYSIEKLNNRRQLFFSEFIDYCNKTNENKK